MLSTAVKFMRFEKSKSIGIIVGIVIAVFLMGQQLSTLGYLTSLMSSIVTHSDPNKADIWVVTEQTDNANNLKSISSSYVNKIRSVRGVAETYPMVIGSATMKFTNGQFSNVLIIGSEAPKMVMGPSQDWIIKGKRSDLIRSGSFTLNANDAKNFRHPIILGMQVELSGKKANIVAITKNVKGYGSSLMYSTIENAREFASLSDHDVNAVIVRVVNKDRVKEVADRINKSFPGVRAWTRNDLIKATQRIILKQSNMGVSFGSLVGFAVISGFFIIGLTLYTSTFDRVKDYGTLKAIGADNKYVSKLVLLQAFLYGIIGYIIAMSLLYLMKIGVASSGLMLAITPLLLIVLLILTLIISVGGAFFAVNKLTRLEPASVFK